MLFPLKLKHLDNPVPLPPVFTITQDLEGPARTRKGDRGWIQRKPDNWNHSQVVAVVGFVVNFQFNWMFTREPGLCDNLLFLLRFVFGARVWSISGNVP